jgi:PAS domain S-box-containing protein
VNDVVRCIPEPIINPGSRWPVPADAHYNNVLTDRRAIAEALPNAFIIAINEHPGAVYTARLSAGWAITAVWLAPHSHLASDRLVTSLLDNGFRLALEADVDHAFTSDMLFSIRSSMDTVAQAVAVVESDNDRVLTNRAAQQLFHLSSGSTPIAEYSRAVADLRSCTTNLDELDSMASVIASDSPSDVTRWLWKFDGPVSHMHVSSSPVTAGPAGRRIWIFEDVSREMSALESSRRSADLLRAITDAVIDPQILVAPVRRDGAIIDFTFIELNDAAATYFGSDRVSLLGEALTAVAPTIEAVGLLDEYIRVVETGIRFIGDNFFLRDNTDSSTRVFDIRAVPAGANLMVSWRDVTESWRQREYIESMEQRYRRLLTNGNVLGARILRGGKLSWVSDAIETILGYRVDEVVGKQLQTICHPDDFELLFIAVKSLRSGSEIERVSFRLAGSDNAYRSFAGTIFLAGDDSNDIEVVATDVTASVESERMRAIVTSVASHEIRTPLAFIYATLNMLRDGTVDPASSLGADLISRMVTSTDRLTRMSNSLLQLQRLELTTELSADEPVLVGAVVRDAVRSVPTERGILVQIFDETADAELLVDDDLLTQAVINLVGNAIKYSPDDGLVRVTSTSTADSVHVSVRDHGRGIPDDAATSIFEAFKQASKNDRRRGAGLGLAIVRRIAEMHRGSISYVRPPDGAGSIFELILRESPVRPR